MRYSLVQTVAPTTQPISLAEAKLNLRVDHDDENTRIEEIIKTAREYCEGVLNRTLTTATWRMKLDCFPTGYYADRWGGRTPEQWGAIVVPRPPLVSVTSITYIDTAGASQTLSASAYNVETDAEPGYIWPDFGTSWPSTREVPNAVTVVFVAGAAASAVPYSIKQLIHLLVAHWHENREAMISGTITKEIELAVESLTWLNRVPAVA